MLSTVLYSVMSSAGRVARSSSRRLLPKLLTERSERQTTVSRSWSAVVCRSPPLAITNPLCTISNAGSTFPNSTASGNMETRSSGSGEMFLHLAAKAPDS